jgi:hypothetical protein
VFVVVVVYFVIDSFRKLLDTPSYIKKGEMGGECSKHSETIMRTKFWSENLKGNNHSVTLCIDERILLNANIHVVVR